MNRFIDPRAPVGLTDSQVNCLKINLRVVQCREIRDNLSKTLRQTYGTIKKAEGTRLHEVYQEASPQLKNEMNKLHISAQKEVR